MKKQQKLGKRNTYTPTDASQVCSSVVLSLNREETLGEQNLKTSSNNLDVNQQSGKTEQDLRIPVFKHVLAGAILPFYIQKKPIHLRPEGRSLFGKEINILSNLESKGVWK